MPKLSLTQSEIKKIIAPETGRIDYFDTELQGFLLRVSADYLDKAKAVHRGAKVFYVQAGVLDLATGKHQTRKAKVGHYGELTPDQARKKAQVLLQLLRTGQPVAPVRAVSLATMLETHLTDHQFKPATTRTYRAEIPTKFASWLDMSLEEISRIQPDVMIDRFKQVEKDHGPMAAKATFKMLHALLAYAKVKYPAAIPNNPCAVIGDAGMWPKTRSRDDCLKGADFKTFLAGLGKFNEITRDCYLFALYHGLRSMEAAALRWEHVDAERGILTIPDTKNGAPLASPLSRQSLAILKRRQEQNPAGNLFVFPSLNAHHACKTGHVALKATLLQFHTGLRLTVHGLRRSFVTTGEKLKLRRQDIDKLTNHIDGSVTGKHYDCSDVDDLRQPLQAIANEMERLMVHGIGAKVVDLATARAAG